MSGFAANQGLADRDLPLWPQGAGGGVVRYESCEKGVFPLCEPCEPAACRKGHPILATALVACCPRRHPIRMTELNPIPDRATTAAARRRTANADRARKWRERQREAELAREAENATLQAEAARLRAELYAVRHERDRLRTHFDRVAKADTVDEDVIRALIKMGAIRRSPAGPLAIGRPTVSVSDVINVAGLVRCGGQDAGQAAYDAARAHVLERVAMLVPPPYDA